MQICIYTDINFWNDIAWLKSFCARGDRGGGGTVWGDDVVRKLSVSFANFISSFGLPPSPTLYVKLWSRLRLSLTATSSAPSGEVLRVFSMRLWHPSSGRQCLRGWKKSLKSGANNSIKIWAHLEHTACLRPTPPPPPPRGLSTTAHYLS